MTCFNFFGALFDNMCLTAKRPVEIGDEKRDQLLKNVTEERKITQTELSKITVHRLMEQLGVRNPKRWTTSSFFCVWCWIAQRLLVFHLVISIFLIPGVKKGVSPSVSMLDKNLSPTSCIRSIFR